MKLSLVANVVIAGVVTGHRRKRVPDCLEIHKLALNGCLAARRAGPSGSWAGRMIVDSWAANALMALNVAMESAGSFTGVADASATECDDLLCR